MQDLSPQVHRKGLSCNYLRTLNLSRTNFVGKNTKILFEVLLQNNLMVPITVVCPPLNNFISSAKQREYFRKLLSDSVTDTLSDNSCNQLLYRRLQVQDRQ